MGSAASLGVLHFAALAGAALLFAAAIWVFWAARAKADDERRVDLPVLGKVGNPTCLTLGLCLFIAAYHTAAYALVPVIALVSVPISRWWIVASALGAAVAGALVAERVERREGP